MTEPSGELVISRALRRNLLCTGAMLSVTLLLLMLLSRDYAEARPLLDRLESIPLQIGEWRGTEGKWGPEVVVALDVDSWILREYEHPSGATVWIYVGVSDSVSFSGGTSPHSPLLCYPGQGWELVETGVQEIGVSGTRSVAVNRLLVQKGLERQLVLYWVQWGGEIAPEGAWGDYWAKLTRLGRLPRIVLEGQRTDTALVRISAPITDGVDEALASQLDFLQEAFPELARRLAFDLSAEPAHF